MTDTEIAKILVALRKMRDPLAWVCDHEVLLHHYADGDARHDEVCALVDCIDDFLRRHGETVSPA